MEYLLLLAEDPDLIATDEQRAEAVQRVHHFAMGLVTDGVLRGRPARPGASGPVTATSASWTVRSPSPRRSSPGTSSSTRRTSGLR
jgi:hypothetical protein